MKKLKTVNWQIKKLGDFCDLQNGFAFKSKDYVSRSETLNFRMSNIRPGGFVDIYHNQKFLPDNYAVKYKDFLLKDGDLVIAMTDMATETKILGVPTIVQTEGKKLLLNQRVGKFFDIQDDKVYVPFLRYMLSSEQVNDYYKSLGRGGMQINIGKQDILNVKIPLPFFSEQQRIVKILDEVFEKIEKAKKNAQKNLQNSKELFESYLQNVFANPGKDWEEKTLEEISSDFGRGKSKHRPRNDKKLYGGEYPFIQTGDIRNSDHYVTEYSQTYNDVGLAQSKLWPKGTICITIAANIAETGILDFDACFPDSVIGLVVDPQKADFNFVEYLLQFFKTRIQAKGKGSAQANINMATFEHEKFPIPSLADQKVIVKKLDALSEQTKKLEEVYKQKLADLEELKKSVLQKAFYGEL